MSCAPGAHCSHGSLFSIFRTVPHGSKRHNPFSRPSITGWCLVFSSIASQPVARKKKKKIGGPGKMYGYPTVNPQLPDGSPRFSFSRKASYSAPPISWLAAPPGLRPLSAIAGSKAARTHREARIISPAVDRRAHGPPTSAFHSMIWQHSSFAAR